MNKIIVNLTGHDITILNDQDQVVKVYPSSGNIRVNQTTVRSKDFDAVSNPISTTIYGGGFIPPVVKGTFYVVSSIVRQSYPSRVDFLLPSETVYDYTGKTIGCRSLDILGGNTNE